MEIQSAKNVVCRGGTKMSVSMYQIKFLIEQGWSNEAIHANTGASLALIERASKVKC